MVRLNNSQHVAKLNVGVFAQTAEYAPQHIFGDMRCPGICGVMHERAEADGHFDSYRSAYSGAT